MRQWCTYSELGLETTSMALKELPAPAWHLFPRTFIVIAQILSHPAEHGQEQREGESGSKGEERHLCEQALRPAWNLLLAPLTMQAHY